MNTEGNNKELSRKLSEEGADNFTGGFSVPENYFEKLQSDIEEKVSRIPILYTTKNENPYAVPEGYFAELENSIREKVSLAKERTASTPLYLRPRFIPVMAMTLVIAVCTITFFKMNRKTKSVSEKDISFNDIYNSAYVAEFDESALADMIDETRLNTTTTQYENYILEDNTDIYTITEEL